MGESSFGKYRLIAELGHGGMADVFLAVQAGPAGSGFKKLTVVKRLRQNLAEEPEFVAMLVDEARIAARLNHPNVVQTNEVGEVNGQYFISMEYLDGQPFHRIQHRSAQRAKSGFTAPFGGDQQCIVLMDTLSGLHHAHELADFDGTSLDIVHRDMTPHNIFVTYEGQVKVVDFGIAKAAGRSSETRQGVVKGKVRYMAPEQAIGQAVDRRADIFSVGVMLWECVSGRRMWMGLDDMEIVQALITGNFPRSPREMDPRIPPSIDAICRKALAQNVEDRYSTAEELRADLEQYLADTGMLVSARRNMPTVVSELFQDKRAELRTVIEKQLAALDFKTTGEFVPVSFSSASQNPLSLSGPPSANGPISSTSPTGSEWPAGTRNTLPVPVWPPTKNAEANFSTPPFGTRFSRRVMPVALGIAAVGALAVVGFAVRRTQAPVPQPLDEISLRVSTSPVQSRIILDDSPARGGPLEMKVARDGRAHRLRIEADGYAPKTESLTFERDVGLSIELVKNLPPPPAVTAPPEPSIKVEKPRAPSAAFWRPAVAPPKPPPVVEAPPPVVPAPVAPAPTPAAEKRAGKLDIDKSDPWPSSGK